MYLWCWYVDVDMLMYLWCWYVDMLICWYVDMLMYLWSWYVDMLMYLWSWYFDMLMILWREKKVVTSFTLNPSSLISGLQIYVYPVLSYVFLCSDMFFFLKICFACSLLRFLAVHRLLNRWPCHSLTHWVTDHSVRHLFVFDIKE